MALRCVPIDILNFIWLIGSTIGKNATIYNAIIMPNIGSYLRDLGALLVFSYSLFKKINNNRRPNPHLNRGGSDYYTTNLPEVERRERSLEVGGRRVIEKERFPRCIGNSYHKRPRR